MFSILVMLDTFIILPFIDFFYPRNVGYFYNSTFYTFFLC